MLVPIIDLKEAERDVAALSPLDKACRDHGFFFLKNHGVDYAIEKMWEEASRFFNQSTKAKRKVYRTESIPLGYYDRELTKRKRDLKEVFDYMQPRSDGSDRNQWPERQPHFYEAMDRFFLEASLVAERTLKLVYRALAGEGINELPMPEGDPRTSTVRLNYYPFIDPLSDDEKDTAANLGDMALHQHTDPGVLTLLLQDMIGGLQTLSKKDGWIDVVPEESSIVVNLGDSLQVWSNDNYRAAVHRVVPMDTLINGGRGRFSTPFFYNPTGNAVLEPLAELSGGSPVYQSFTWRDYIKGRVDDNFTDLGEEDIQIAQFRI